MYYFKGMSTLHYDTFCSQNRAKSSTHLLGQKSSIPSLPASDLSFRTAIGKGIYALYPILISFERTTIHKEWSQCTLSTTKNGDRPMTQKASLKANEMMILGIRMSQSLQLDVVFISCHWCEWKRVDGKWDYFQSLESMRIKELSVNWT